MPAVPAFARHLRELLVKEPKTGRTGLIRDPSPLELNLQQRHKAVDDLEALCATSNTSLTSRSAPVQ